ncbi:MAG: hypothetical protein H6608_09700 [Flavobacteriales bacterium]|nr:hypothetical protein [Bacteroidota bacterium]MCB9241395.1 hypothetical protein [Flavobacteriales bacterium]
MNVLKISVWLWLFLQSVSSGYAQFYRVGFQTHVTSDYGVIENPDIQVLRRFGPGISIGLTGAYRLNSHIDLMSGVFYKVYHPEVVVTSANTGFANFVELPVVNFTQLPLSAGYTINPNDGNIHFLVSAGYQLGLWSKQVVSSGISSSIISSPSGSQLAVFSTGTGTRSQVVHQLTSGVGIEQHSLYPFVIRFDIIHHWGFNEICSADVTVAENGNPPQQTSMSSFGTYTGYGFTISYVFRSLTDE